MNNYLKAIDSFTGEYKWLSNYWLCNITYEGIVYPSNEHAYQAMKTLDPELRLKISRLETPGQAKGAGQVIPLRADWRDVSLQIMEAVNTLKFRDPELRKKLTATVGHELIEGNHHGDKFWGTVDGIGENHLGKILMKIRSEIIDEEFPGAF